MEISNIRYLGHDTDYRIMVSFDLHKGEDLYSLSYLYWKDGDEFSIQSELEEDYNEILTLIRSGVVSYNDYFMGNYGIVE